MLEEVADRRAETGIGPDPTETAAKLADVTEQNRGVQGAAKRAAYECSSSAWGQIDRLILRPYFGDRNPAVDDI